MKKNVWRIVPLLALAAFVGCTATLQSARVLEPGEWTMGAGTGLVLPSARVDGGSSRYASFPMNNWTLDGPHYFCRAGLGGNLDAGLRWTIPQTVLADVKYQVLRWPLLVALGLGVGASGYPSWGSPDVVPLVMVGLERREPQGEPTEWYVGFKPIYRFAEVPAGDKQWGWVPVFVLGHTRGGRWQVLADVNFAWGEHWDAGLDLTQPWPQTVSLCCGMQYHFGRLAQ